MAEGFFSRWSQRKEAVRQGKEIAPEPERPSPHPSPRRGEGETPPLPLAGEGRGEGDPAHELPPPTLADAQSLTTESDFTRFVRPDVAPDVKNTALKKLFSDPHFNKMDGLDVYIDDYNKPDPMPASMLKQLASAQFLRLVEEPGATPDAGAQESVAQSGTRTAQALPPADDHADPDLRLQQDHAPGPEGPGQGTG